MARAKRPVLKFKLLDKNAKLPSYAHDEDAAFDISTTSTDVIRPGECKIFPTGIVSEISKGWFASIRGRGGVSKYGIDVLGGVVDAGYRGEWRIILANVGKKNYKVEKGERIAQAILLPCRQAKIISAKKLSKSKRGEEGFGSTGRK